MSLRPHLAALRAAMAAFPALEAHTASKEINPDEIYFPKSHAAALDPERSLVIGNRGMGKSFWANALVGPETRETIARALPESRLATGKVDVVYGFAEAEGSVGVSRDELANLWHDGVSAEMIWRAETLPHIARSAGQVVPLDRSDRLQWVREQPDAVRDILRRADRALSDHGSRLVFVFDQLEQLADDLERRRNLTQGILRLALAYKSYRNLRLKVFMRPDQRADDQLFQFPDSSKISGEAVELDWRATDLYGLLYARLGRDRPMDFEQVARAAGINLSVVDALAGIPWSLVHDERAQHAFFDRVAGPFMGSDPRRGKSYTWLVLHLADSRNQVSPRTFLRAIKYAADAGSPPADTAIDYRGIHEGVNEAAKNRVEDLKEDYPWVPPALKRLNGLSVPCQPEDMLARWRDPSIMPELRRVTPNSKTPAWLIDPAVTEPSVGRARDPLQDLLAAMATIGVIERRETTGKVDVPDIFRLPDDIRRRGGVTPQQRRNARLG